MSDRTCSKCGGALVSRSNALYESEAASGDYRNEVLIEQPAGDRWRDQMVGELLRLASYNLVGLCPRCVPKVPFRLQVVV